MSIFFEGSEVAGDSVDIKFSRMHFFDKETGEAIGRGKNG